MAAQILPMPGFKAPADPVGYFVRLGDSGHRQLADLHAEGRFSPKQVAAIIEKKSSKNTGARLT